MNREHKQEIENRKERFYRIAGMIGSVGAGAFSSATVEKVTLNIPAAEAKQIDLLVEQELYVSRADFLLTAATNLLQEHGIHVELAVNQSTSSKLTVASIAIHNHKSLEKLRAAGSQLDLYVTGIFRLSDDVTPELACAVIRSLKIRGSFQASPEVKDALKDRIC